MTNRLRNYRQLDGAGIATAREMLREGCSPAYVARLAEDVPAEKIETARDRDGKWGEEAITAAGFEYIESL